MKHIKGQMSLKQSGEFGESIAHLSAVFYDDVSEKTGEVKEILSILGKDGRVYATNSPYFIRDFRKMVELFTQMGKPLDRVAVVRSVSGKTGRDFITCSVVR